MRAREECCKENCDCSIVTNGEDFYIDGSNCEVQIDITTAKEKQSVMIWGSVKDCCGEPIKNALVKLLKYEQERGNCLKGICHTFTDCNGYYQFDLSCNSQGKYRVIASKTMLKDCDYDCCNHSDPVCCCKKPFYDECYMQKNKVYYY